MLLIGFACMLTGGLIYHYVIQWRLSKTIDRLQDEYKKTDGILHHEYAITIRTVREIKKLI